jgi:HEXXH motif-containing protein
VAGEADWLVHPCVNALTHGEDVAWPERDLLLAVWAAVHAREPLGRVTLVRPMRLWSVDGGFEVPAGTYELGDLAAQAVEADWPYRPTLDVWCHSLGFRLPDTWTEADAEADRRRLDAEVMAFLRTLAAATAAVPECVGWVGSVTRVVVPLRGTTTELFRSGSHDSIPGMTYMDLNCGELSIVEALLHESAHRHLFFAEAEGPLVDPGHTDRYSSPLRPEPRPLRGILLAYHAIAYICAGFVDLRDRLSSAAEYCRRELRAMRVKLDESESTLVAHRRFLTPSGDAFLNETLGVADHGRG